MVLILNNYKLFKNIVLHVQYYNIFYFTFKKVILDKSCKILKRKKKIIMKKKRKWNKNHLKVSN